MHNEGKLMRNLYKELSEYAKRDYEMVKAKCQISHFEISWEWEEYKDRPIEFYRETDLYIYSLTQYQMKLQAKKIHNWYQYMIKKHGWKNGLDFGGGIGEQTILAFEEGVKKMVFTDVANSKTLEYAMWRFKKISKIGFYLNSVNLEHYEGIVEIENENFVINKDFDFIVAMDVLEHLENPDPVIKKIHKHTEWLFCNPEQVKYNKYAPEHISKFDLTKYFEHQDLYLWRRKKGGEKK